MAGKWLCAKRMVMKKCEVLLLMAEQEFRREGVKFQSTVSKPADLRVGKRKKKELICCPDQR
jgi:hypothetical protein